MKQQSGKYGIFHVPAIFSRHAALLLLCVCAAFMAQSVSAQGIFADSPCDIEGYYESLEARAWLEAQREITQNQNLIFKPDSVLEYTCFDGYLSELADHAVDLFSETPRFGTPPPGNMADSLTALVGTALEAYELANFRHPLLGGRIVDFAPVPVPATPNDNLPDGVDYILPNVIEPGDYTCGVMNAVWLKAKCMDFVDNIDNDGFFTFEEYRDDPDKRFLPTVCNSAIAPDYQGNLDIAFAVDDVPWVRDNLIIYNDSLLPPDGGCGEPFPTGLVVHNSKNTGPRVYDEHVCIVPGCYYVPGPNECTPSQ